jgi:putative two-component system response regulator
VFDALTTARPCKKPWNIEDTIAELERGKGTHFDPGLIDLFKQIFPRIRGIRQSLLEQAVEKESN